ncbi:hypothetical protein [Clostridium beijerinckii]|uniref:hypothetical protein n=1 Tax=Clostridium beijerinckii TaxID=1520 RepID=UPI00098C3AE2|nr:hypothetical protein [Clostridium beijerinckii]MBA8937300.1 hypothetical protein [Clostridium beijerinckii]NRU40234.1 hypothetical protein [Clostridium beijerinckii]NSA96489.1 hypothetical protein [Clostridium beijerinckii]OOM63027.1 hypothetical protein CLOBI_20830 [Clostridium beijerinckii]OOM64567.1 hypothetical protein CLBEIC_54880 [Clostridium beijerinckii]
MVNIMKNAKKMIDCGELRVVFTNLECTFTGATIDNNGQKVIILNSNLTYEYNIKKLLHELIHLRHFNSDLETPECESEAIEFENNPIALQRLIQFATNVI